MRKFGVWPGDEKEATVGFGPVGRLSRLPALILGPRDQPRSAREEGPGGGIGCEGPGEGPGPPNLTLFTIFEPGRAVVEPSRHSLLHQTTTRQNLHFPLVFHYSGPRIFIFLRNFTILEFLGHRLPGYPHQTLENLQAKPYCTCGPADPTGHYKLTLGLQMHRSGGRSACAGGDRTCMPALSLIHISEPTRPY